MLQIANILYPTDFSPGARAALPYALDLTRRHAATVHVLHVEPRFSGDAFEAALRAFVDERVFYDQVRAEAGQRMRALLPADALGVDVRYAHERSLAPGPAVKAYTSAADIDLIVMGTHGRRGVRRLVLGSTAEEVVRASDVPVLVVRESEGQPSGAPVLRRLMVPIDFTPVSETLLRYACELAALYGASLDLVHVLDMASYPELYVVSLVERGRRLVQQEAESKAELKALFERVGEPTLQASFHVLVGYAPEEIGEFARESGASMVVIASHGREGLDRVLLGSVTERVVRAAPCAVLVVKPFGRPLLPALAHAEAHPLAGTAEQGALGGGP